MEGPSSAAARYRTVFFVLAAMLFALFLGLRYEVGADWSDYERDLLRAGSLPFSAILRVGDIVLAGGDPAYVFLNWIVYRVGGNVVPVNLVCGAIFSWGLVAFCLNQPRPWLALTVAVPYLVIVVAMGYTRQGVAIGLVMIGLIALTKQNSPIKFCLWVLLAATFHKSAILLIPLAIMSTTSHRWLTVVAAILFLALGYYVLVFPSLDKIISTYISARYDSAGAAVRVVLSTVPAILFIWYRNLFVMPDEERKIWFNLSVLALAMVPMLIIVPSSTAVDRAGLYLIPVQLVVWSRLPDALSSSVWGARSIAGSRDSNLCGGRSGSVVWFRNIRSLLGPL